MSKKRGRPPRPGASRKVIAARAKFVRMNLGTEIGSSAVSKFAKEMQYEVESYRGIENKGANPGEGKLAEAYARHSEVKRRKLNPQSVARWVLGAPGDPPLGENGATIQFHPVDSTPEVERARELNAAAKDLEDMDRLASSLTPLPHERIMIGLQAGGMLWQPALGLVQMGQDFFLSNRLVEELRTAEILLQMVQAGVERLRAQVKNGSAAT